MDRRLRTQEAAGNLGASSSRLDPFRSIALRILSDSAVAVGFLGAYTTYSTFSWDLFTLGRTDGWASATIYLGLPVVLGVLAAALGHRLGNSAS